MKPNPQGRGKKPYEKPNLRLYGDIQAVTKATVHHVGSNDSKSNKT